jgi:hypothetical protein
VNVIIRDDTLGLNRENSKSILPIFANQGDLILGYSRGKNYLLENLIQNLGLIHQVHIHQVYFDLRIIPLVSLWNPLSSFLR